MDASETQEQVPSEKKKKKSAKRSKKGKK